MKHKNVKVGQHVVIKRSTSAIRDKAAEHIGEEFRVAAVEPLDYIGDSTVLLKNDGAYFWYNHKDISRVKEQAAPVSSAGEAPAPQVGDLFEVVDHNYCHDFNNGTAVRLVGMENDGLHMFENEAGLTQYLDGADIRALTKEDIWARLTAKPLSLADSQEALDK